MKMQLKNLYNIARNELSDIVPIEDSGFRLEQAEYNKNENLWEVVVSYLVENRKKSITSLSTLTDLRYDRLYKTVKIKDSGEFAGFYIYNEQ